MGQDSWDVDAVATQHELSRALAAVRKRKGLTQKTLADRLGLDPTYISQVERGR